MGHRITILLGTTKGAFLATSADERKNWEISGPHCNGWPINHVIGDPRTGHLWAGGGNAWYGAGVWMSDDGGANWSLSKLASGQMDEWAANDPEFAEMIGWKPGGASFDGEADAVWSLAFDHGVLHAGCKPGKLYQSRDGGETWQSVSGFNDHPDRENWNPGAAGLILHTIMPHPENPKKIWLGVSAAGVFASEDGGGTFESRNRLANGEKCDHHDHPAAPRDGATGLCVHNMAMDVQDDDELIYQQNHHGVYKSADGGRSWHDITEGLPSTFGFPIALNPHDRQMLWVLPLNGDMAGRYPPGASAAVWKSVDGGATWQAKQSGLPVSNCFFTVLRQAMATDRQDSTGIYFGTNTGSVFASTDEGENWREIASHLPTILSVEVLDGVRSD